MSRGHIVWGVGGQDLGHPSQNKVEELEYSDEYTVTYRRWDEAGVLLEERPAVDADFERFAPGV